MTRTGNNPGSPVSAILSVLHFGELPVILVAAVEFVELFAGLAQRLLPDTELVDFSAETANVGLERRQAGIQARIAGPGFNLLAQLQDGVAVTLLQLLLLPPVITSGRGQAED
jgi:hypothetical protein